MFFAFKNRKPQKASEFVDMDSFVEGNHDILRRCLMRSVRFTLEKLSEGNLRRADNSWDSIDARTALTEFRFSKSTLRLGQDVRAG